MKKVVFTFILFCTLYSLTGQTGIHPAKPKTYLPKETAVFYKLGDRTIQLKKIQYGDVKDIVYINLHDDEITAINGAKKLLEKKGGLLIKIENLKNRNIKFRLDEKYYTFDPNRIFSRTGIIQTLTIYGRINNKAITEVEKFAARILQLIPERPSCIIALHNNTNGKFSITSYLAGNIREKDAKKIYSNLEEDPDDFFLTTDSVMFQHLANGKYNAVWQDSKNAKKDGSLSIYCGERNICYVNCETEHGRQMQYQQMIMLAVSHIERENPAVITYNYKITQPIKKFYTETNSQIMFGEKKIGSLIDAGDSLNTIAGKLWLHKNFPLYSNMDFFLSKSSARLEVRIDPTRKKELRDPATTIINIKVVK
jgi:hypothetical protein